MEKAEQMIKQFVVPNELREGLVYLQRSLRDHIIQHQTLASNINNVPMNERAKVKKCMLELEHEIVSIGHEQQGMVRQLSEKVKRFQLQMQSRSAGPIPDDLLYGYVARQLHTHHETAVYKVPPKHVTPRSCAYELSQKYSLEYIIVAHIDLDDYNEDSNHPAPCAGGTTAMPTANSHVATKTYPKTGTATTTASGSGTKNPRSLLKPKQPPVASAPAIAERPFASVADQKPPVLQEEVLNTTPEKSSDEDNEDPEAEYEDDGDTRSKKGHRSSVGNVVRMRGRPPKGAKKHVLVFKMASAVPQATQQPPTVPRRVSKRKDALEEKVDPLEQDSGEEEQTTPRLPMTAAVRRGRSNLLQALNRQKRLSTGPSNGPKPDASTSGTSKLAKHASSGSSGSSPNSRSSTPTWNLARPVSDDSCDRRSPSSEFQAPPEVARDPPVPTPLSVHELEQPTFLRYFGLYTPEQVKAIRERKRERKRRSCYSTERKDFHYGKLDYYEQQQQYQTVRTSKRAHKRPILYSPSVAVAKKRKHPPPQPAAAMPTTSSAGSSSTGRTRQQPSSNIFAAMDNRCCFVCSKTGSTDELSACMNCCNIYHLNCHRLDEDGDAHGKRDNYCPVCLTLDDVEK